MNSSVSSKVWTMQLRVKDGYGFVVYVFPPDAEKALRALQRGGLSCGSADLQSLPKDIGTDQVDEVKLKQPSHAKVQLTCYRCGGSGHKMRNCPQLNTSLRKSTRKASKFKWRKKLPLGKGTDKSWKKRYEGKKRSRKETRSPKRRSAKKARRSRSVSPGADSLLPESRSSSTSHYSRSKSYHVPVPFKNLDSERPVSSFSGHLTSLSSEELSVVLKHYYGLDLQAENERHLPADAYFGSARLWPWEIIYHRRLKKGPISIENYARRVDQNREFGIDDKLSKY
ncbi:hypothetical protein GH714_030857 [Hevea brasiliensis]|uniref:CCHC-type domain-containing protein n=1 Tax=Hevea brasiliensis TaxID=3981 RepID=A0A6A6M5R9_HEVBR|nr:hypothetical protein GH714_030857 [Hevea brasiliensis]